MPLSAMLISSRSSGRSREDTVSQRAFLAAVLHGVVKQVEYHVGEVHLVDSHYGVHRVEVGGYGASVFFDFQLEGVYDIENGRIGVDFL